VRKKDVPASSVQPRVLFVCLGPGMVPVVFVVQDESYGVRNKIEEGKSSLYETK